MFDKIKTAKVSFVIRPPKRLPLFLIIFLLLVVILLGGWYYFFVAKKDKGDSREVSRPTETPISQKKLVKKDGSYAHISELVFFNGEVEEKEEGFLTVSGDSDKVGFRITDETVFKTASLENSGSDYIQFANLKKGDRVTIFGRKTDSISEALTVIIKKL